MHLRKFVIIRLREIFGKDTISGDQVEANDLAQDHNKFYSPMPYAIVFPRKVKQLQSLLQFANEYKVALVPSGGRTGLSAGATANNGEVVVSFNYMNQIGSYNERDRLVECEAGVVTHDLQLFATERGMLYPVDFASSGSSQIGGNIATNAGGIKVIRYGLTRDQVAGLTVITGRGELLTLNRGLIKNATGYDLRHLFIGSEGTLGFIVKAQMRLIDAPRNLQVMLLSVDSITDLMNVLSLFRSSLSLTAFEFFCDNAMQRVLARLGRKSPLETSSTYYALLEFDAHCDLDINTALTLFETCQQNHWVQEGVLAQSTQQAAGLWKLRENISETLARFTPYKNDLSVQVAKIPDFIANIEALVNEHYPEFPVLWYGHIGDGNLHLNVLKPDTMEIEVFKHACEKVNDEIFSMVQAFGGSISAEHGVGLQKRTYLSYTRSQMEIDIMRAIKAVFDPNGIMNPGKLLPDEHAGS